MLLVVAVAVAVAHHTLFLRHTPMTAALRALTLLHGIMRYRQAA
jgi:hypothetical protein